MISSWTVVATGFVVVSSPGVVVTSEDVVVDTGLGVVVDTGLGVVVDTGLGVVVPLKGQSRIGGSAGPLIAEHLKEEESKN